MSDSLQIQTLQDRLDRTQELTEFTEKCKKQLDDIFEKLGWSRDFEDPEKVRLFTSSLVQTRSKVCCGEE